MVRDLLAARADVNSRSMKEKIGVPKGHMALMSAAISGHAEVCTELISAQASVATQNGLGMSALHCSVMSSRSAPVVETSRPRPAARWKRGWSSRLAPCH